jgi:hypothetical protein
MDDARGEEDPARGLGNDSRELGVKVHGVLPHATDLGCAAVGVFPRWRVALSDHALHGKLRAKLEVVKSALQEKHWALDVLLRRRCH